jgi:ribosome biogenesis GTPase
MEGIIIKQISNDYTVASNNEFYICKPRGRFRNQNITPMVGDYVEFSNNRLDDIKSRKNVLNRPTIANVDQALLVISAKKPDLDLVLLDKLLVTIISSSVEPIICFTKLDLLTPNELKDTKKIMNYYAGYFKVCDNTNLSKIKKYLKNKTTVLTGQSGAGKSTLLNKLDINLNIETNEISRALGRGKHTTRHVELLSIDNMFIADTPGFSSVDLDSIPKEVIRDTYPEFELLKAKCPYRDCMHDKETICAIKDEVGKSILESRYNNYIKFIRR